jgi:hypothetical protein
MDNTMHFTINGFAILVNDMGLHGKETTISTAIERRHSMALGRILNKENIWPMIDVVSHKDVYIITNACLCLGMTKDAIVSSFRNWVNYPKWVDMFEPEYLYLVYKEFEELVDFKLFFRESPNIIPMMNAIRNVDEVKTDSELYVEIISFFANYKFETCFTENNELVQLKLKELNLIRCTNWELFLINPHDSNINGYFTHIPDQVETWDCSNLSVVKPPSLFGDVIVDYETATDRFDDFTYSLINKEPGDDIKLPIDNCVFAGGSINKILSSNYEAKNARQSDCDIFIIAETYKDRSDAYEKILAWFNSAGKTYYAVRGSVTSIYIKNIPRKFQIITNDGTNPLDVIGRFDMTHIQWCMYKGKFYGTPEACSSMRSKVSYIHNMKRLRPLRLIKTLHCGYSIHKNNTIIDEHIDITEIVNNPKSPQTQKMLRELYHWYYPRDEPNLDGEDEHQHILSMIELDSKATTITDDIDVANNSVVINGSFDSDYESMSYTTFNAGFVNTMINRNIDEFPLRTIHGTVKLVTKVIKLSKVLADESNINLITGPVDDEFAEFCRQIEGPVIRLFTHRRLDNKLLNDNSQVVFKLPQWKVKHYAAKGKSCLINQRGAALDISEDLKCGDSVQIIFLIIISRKNISTHVELKPVKIIKHLDKLEINVTNDIKLPAEGEFIGNIEYNN